MNRARIRLLIVAVLLIGGLAGRWLADQATEVGDPQAADTAETVTPRPKPLRDGPIRDLKTERGPGSVFTEDSEAEDAGALRNQRTITFSSVEAMEAFLKKAQGKGIALLGRIDALKTLRVGFLSLDELRGLLEGEEQLGMIFPAFVPGQGTVQPGAVGFGDLFLDWLGVTGDRSQIGTNFKIAVLDTGVVVTDAFTGQVISKNFVDLPADLSLINSHGTSVAAIIAAQLGLSPGATILDFRVADDNGVSNTFTLAEAVLAAVQDGAEIINMSLGSRGFSQVLENALQVAYEAGIAVVVSTGNEGLDSVSYPASSRYTVAVGAVEGRGDHLDFSNSGEVSLVAPGLALTSVDQYGNAVSFSGTSAAAPTVSGAIAYIMDTFDVSALNAVQILYANANETGPPGYDSLNGEGILNVGRAVDSQTTGISDVAIASNHFTTDSNGVPIVQVTVENRGTTTLSNSPISVTTPGGTSNANIPFLEPGDIRTLSFNLGATSGNVSVQSSVNVSSGAADQNPQDNQRVDSFSLSDSP